MGAGHLLVRGAGLSSFCRNHGGRSLTSRTSGQTSVTKMKAAKARVHKNSTAGLGVWESENKQLRPRRPASKALCLQSCRTRGQHEPRAARRPELPDKDDTSPRRAISGEATDSSQGHKARGHRRPPLARTVGPSCPRGAGHRGVPSKPALPLQVDVHRSDPGRVLADIPSLSTRPPRSEVTGSELGRQSDPRHPDKTSAQ